MDNDASKLTTRHVPPCLPLNAPPTPLCRRHPPKLMALFNPKSTGVWHTLSCRFDQPRTCWRCRVRSQGHNVANIEGVGATGVAPCRPHRLEGDNDEVEINFIFLFQWGYRRRKIVAVFHWLWACDHQMQSYGLGVANNYFCIFILNIFTFM
jgi:hypothetical protein